MQCSMCNQCSDLFTCIMNYLHVLCMIFMVLSCVLCMTLMIFIYVYTICMYKFSRCHVVVFHGFFVPFTDFRQKSADF
jgi:hypothetical protein